jgi:hypothetical protein
MRLIDDIKRDARAVRRMRLSWQGLFCVMAASGLVCWLCDHFGRLDLASPLMTSASALGYVLVLKRPWIRYAWFWIAITVVAALQVELILSVHWPTKWIPARNWAGAAMLDFVAITLILDVVERLVERWTPPLNDAAVPTSHVRGTHIHRDDRSHHDRSPRA